jgi:hypothetical protein
LREVTVNKRKELLAAVKARELRPREDIKEALSGKRRTRKWVPQMLSFRSKDVQRTDELLDGVLREGVRATKSQIVRAGLLALKERTDTAALVRRLDD